MALDIDERHLLRLGHGEEALRTEKDFSRLVEPSAEVVRQMVEKACLSSSADLGGSTLFLLCAWSC